MKNVVVHVTAGSCLAALVLASGGSRGVEEAVLEDPRGTGRGLALRAEAYKAEQERGTRLISVTLHNEGVETATHIQPLVLPSHFRLLRDGCTAEPLPAAASCGYTLALEEAAPHAGTLGLQVRYDYADTLDRSVGGTVSYPEMAVMAASDHGD
jgi:hypothetical protein